MGWEDKRQLKSPDDGSAMVRGALEAELEDGVAWLHESGVCGGRWRLNIGTDHTIFSLSQAATKVCRLSLELATRVKQAQCWRNGDVNLIFTCSPAHSFALKSRPCPAIKHSFNKPYITHKMSSPTALNHALLKPAILQVLRAVGYHSAKPSVVETLADLTARYMMLLASQTASWAQDNHQSTTPDITDVRLALTDVGMLGPTTQASEEVWREILRHPLDSIPDRNGLRAIEASRRTEEDTEDVQQFVAWFSGRICEEINRISGHVQEKAQVQAQTQSQVAQVVEKGQAPEAAVEADDYLTGS
jgi:hypothetical protein